MNDIQAIQNAIQAGCAYEIDGYFFFDRAKLPCRKQPRLYESLQKIARDPGDYVVWAPSASGKPSPWGPGYSTVNICRSGMLNQIF